ncbi:MAG: hypothetical protein OEY97_04050 [Nitrospirota bacterium]|nr:hypothetical protein [Nitrospirota bacterium]
MPILRPKKNHFKMIFNASICRWIFCSTVIAVSFVVPGQLLAEERGVPVSVNEVDEGSGVPVSISETMDIGDVREWTPYSALLGAESAVVGTLSAVLTPGSDVPLYDVIVEKVVHGNGIGSHFYLAIPQPTGEDGSHPIIGMKTGHSLLLIKPAKDGAYDLSGMTQPYEAWSGKALLEWEEYRSSLNFDLPIYELSSGWKSFVSLHELPEDKGYKHNLARNEISSIYGIDWSTDTEAFFDRIRNFMLVLADPDIGPESDAMKSINEGRDPLIRQFAREVWYFRFGGRESEMKGQFIIRERYR